MKKKLIEVALPLEAINKAAAREKSIRHGHPSTLHLWWARRPLAAARAVIFAQMVDDPSSLPDLFPTEQKQQKERERLFRILEELVQWENTTNEAVLEKARAEIWQSWRRACADNADHPRAKELFDRQRLPAFHDPFAGGGALPLEAQRLGLEAYASDLNPVAVLINKAMIEIPPRFAGRPPVNPEARREKTLIARQWRGAQGLAEDVRYYGRWMRDEAEKRIGHLYPKIEVTSAVAKERPDLKPLVGKKLTVIAWLWARTVKSPNPAFRDVDVPLASTFMLSTKAGKEAYVEPVIENGGYRFTVKLGKPRDAARAKNGTKLSRGANFECVMSGTPIEGDYIKAEGRAGRMGARLMAIVAEGERGRVYLAPTPEHEAAARKAQPEWKPEGEIAKRMTGGNCTPYGLTRWADLFTPRQLVALTTFSDLVGEAMARVKADALAAGLPDDPTPLRDGGTGATAYAEAVGVYLALSVDKVADRNSTVCVAVPKAEELVATPYRHGSKEKAETFFLDGMTRAMHRLVEQSHPAFPVTIYYAFKQSESETAAGTASTGWETFLDAVIRAGFGISGTWPMRTELDRRMIGSGTNALASSIVLVCRQRAADAPIATRREFLAALKHELPVALRHLQQGNIAPVDLAQAAIGPGMAVYTRYAKVLDAEGKPVPVREALALINQVLDETLAEQEGDFDADTRFAIAWFEQHGFAEGEFGVAETLSKAKNTSLDGLEKAGILKKGRGKVQLVKPGELPEDWDPATDERLTHWETVHHLIRVLETGGESAAAALVAKLGSQAETARELAYRLYTLCERKKRAAEALQYNALVQSWPEIARLAQNVAQPSSPEQGGLFGGQG